MFVPNKTPKGKEWDSRTTSSSMENFQWTLSTGKTGKQTPKMGESECKGNTIFINSKFLRDFFCKKNKNYNKTKKRKRENAKYTLLYITRAREKTNLFKLYLLSQITLPHCKVPSKKVNQQTFQTLTRKRHRNTLTAL